MEQDHFRHWKRHEGKVGAYQRASGTVRLCGGLGTIHLLLHPLLLFLLQLMVLTDAGLEFSGVVVQGVNQECLPEQCGNL